ncbi:MAG: NADP-dependent oxidoreductase [Janthinobacterium lividum]
MRAVRFHGYGGLDELRHEEAPDPVIGAGEVLVRVHAAGVNPFDWYSVEGYVNQYVTFRLPAVLGRDFSGIVEAVGNDAGGFAVGDAVYGQTDPKGHGTFAELTAVEVGRLARKPAFLSHVEAASLPNVLFAAWDGLFSESSGADLQAGQAVLVHGAAGGIGSVAVQLARWRGAAVAGTASGANLRFLRELGVRQAFDYTVPGWQDGVGSVDAVLDTSGGAMATELCELIRLGGRYVTLRGLPPAAFMAEQADRGVACLAASGPASLGAFAKMTGLVADGSVKAVVSGVYPIDAVRAALELMRGGHVRGKLVLSVKP